MTIHPLSRMAFETGKPALVLAAFVWLFMTPVSKASFVIRSRLVGKTHYVYLDDVAKYYGMQVYRKGRHVVLAGNGKRFDVSVKARSAKINGVKVDLAMKIVENGGLVLLAERDLSLLVDPVFRGWGMPRRNVRTIVIDPGHGGRDPGAVGTAVREKDVSLMVGLRLKAILEKQGYRVAMTRGADNALTLAQRGRIKGDLFVSLHCNTAGNKGVTGIETWYAAPVGSYSSKTPNLAYRDKVTGNQSDGQNQRLAYEIQRYIMHTTGSKTDRGLKKSRFQVLRQSKVPSVLVEMGFLSNQGEQTLLMNEDYQNRMALGLANGIISFHRAVAPQAPR